MADLRVYPTCCTSAYCGRLSCEGCQNKPALDEFKAWRDRTQAERTDPTWCPTVYTAGAGRRS
mgnify:CR=1 FL=1